MIRKENLILLFSIFFCVLNVSSFAQKRISITIDDPNTKTTPKLNWSERDSLILKALEDHNIKAALFVCGMRVDDSNGKLLLNNWDSKNHLICNHSYSHLYYHSKTNTSEIFISDFNKGDSIIRTYNNYCRLFRFPYLKEGNYAEKRDSMRAEMNNKGYKNGYVSVDASDWYIDSQIIATLENDANSDLTPYKEYYIKHILERVNYYDSLACLMFQRNIKHTLLIHHSLLNALFLNDLLSALKAKGWELIDAKEAYKDEVFQKQPNIEPCGESIIWQCARQIETLAKNLRYPAEDSEYEKLPLENYLIQYELKTNKK